MTNGEMANGEIDNDLALWQAFHEAVLEIGSSGIDRIRDSAKQVQVSATAIQGVYGAVLGVVFAAGKSALPIRGVFPALFLGLAIVLATFFISFLVVPENVASWQGGPTLREAQVSRSFWFVAWTRSAYVGRFWLLQSATVALAIGVFLFPLPFLSPGAGADAAASAPEIPEAIAPEVAETATEVFDKLADKFLSEPGSTEVAAADCDHGFWSPFYRCSWTTSDKILNQTSFWVAVWGLILMALVPIVTQVISKVRGDDEPRSIPGPLGT